MPRPERLLIDDGIYLLSAYGNNRQPVFYDPADYLRYLEQVKRFSDPVKGKLYHYALLPGAIHLVIGFKEALSPGTLMRRLNLSHTRYFNRKYARRGHLWHDRFRSTVVEPGSPLLRCGSLLEMLPVREMLVRSPRQYPWSSAATWGWDGERAMAQPSDAYLKLGKTKKERLEAYRKMLEAAPDVAEPEQLATEGVLGDVVFRRQVFRKNADRKRPPRGRPAKV